MAATVFEGPHFCASPVWSPDGSQIAFVSSRHIWLVGTDRAGAPRRLASSLGARRVRWPRRSPRLYASGFWTGEDMTIRVVDPLTESIVPLPFAAVLGQSDDYVDFDVSSDERLIVFDRERLSGAIWLWKDMPR